MFALSFKKSHIISPVGAQPSSWKDRNRLLLDIYCFPDDMQIMLLFKTTAAAGSASLFTLITAFRFHPDPYPIIGYAQARWAISEISSTDGCL